MNVLFLFKKMKYFLFITLFIHLIVLMKLTKAVDLHNLKVVCDIRNGLGDVQFDNLPTCCTAVATSLNNDTTISEMIKTPLANPFILYFSGFSYDDWDNFLNVDNAYNFIIYMQSKNFNGIIFNRMFQPINPMYDAMRNEKIFFFFQKLKELNPNGLYGLALPKHAELLPGAFNYQYMDKVVDFYVVQTLRYRKCEYQRFMKKPTTEGDMEKSLDSIKDKIPMSKVLLTVQVFAEVVTEDSSSATVVSYAQLCDDDYDSDKKYCKDSLGEIWDKASLCNTYGMLGIYIQHVDLDDYKGSCRCKDDTDGITTFPATHVAAAGASGISVDTLTSCDTFAYV